MGRRGRTANSGKEPATSSLMRAGGRRQRSRKRWQLIVRVLRVRVKATKVGAFNAVFRAQVPLLKAQPGLVYVKLARRLQSDAGEEVLLFEEWEDAASLYAWAGGDLSEPRLVPGARELAEEIFVAHYEALDKHTDEAAAELTHAHQVDAPVHEPAAHDGPPGEPGP